MGEAPPPPPAQKKVHPRKRVSGIRPRRHLPAAGGRVPARQPGAPHPTETQCARLRPRGGPPTWRGRAGGRTHRRRRRGGPFNFASTASKGGPCIPRCVTSGTVKGPTTRARGGSAAGWRPGRRRGTPPRPPPLATRARAARLEGAAPVVARAGGIERRRSGREIFFAGKPRVSGHMDERRLQSPLNSRPVLPPP